MSASSPTLEDAAALLDAPFFDGMSLLQPQSPTLELELAAASASHPSVPGSSSSSVVSGPASHLDASQDVRQQRTSHMTQSPLIAALGALLRPLPSPQPPPVILEEDDEELKQDKDKKEEEGEVKEETTKEEEDDDDQDDEDPNVSTLSDDTGIFGSTKSESSPVLSHGTRLPISETRKNAVSLLPKDDDNADSKPAHADFKPIGQPSAIISKRSSSYVSSNFRLSEASEPVQKKSNYKSKKRLSLGSHYNLNAASQDPAIESKLRQAFREEQQQPTQSILPKTRYSRRHNYEDPSEHHSSKRAYSQSPIKDSPQSTIKGSSLSTKNTSPSTTHEGESSKDQSAAASYNSQKSKAAASVPPTRKSLEFEPLISRSKLSFAIRNVNGSSQDRSKPAKNHLDASKNKPLPPIVKRSATLDDLSRSNANRDKRFSFRLLFKLKSKPHSLADAARSQNAPPLQMPAPRVTSLSPTTETMNGPRPPRKLASMSFISALRRNKSSDYIARSPSPSPARNNFLDSQRSASDGHQIREVNDSPERQNKTRSNFYLVSSASSFDGSLKRPLSAHSYAAVSAKSTPRLGGAFEAPLLRVDTDQHKHLDLLLLKSSQVSPQRQDEPDFLGNALFPKSLNPQEVESIVSLERLRLMRSVGGLNKRSSFVNYQGSDENIIHYNGPNHEPLPPIARSTSILKNLLSHKQGLSLKSDSLLSNDKKSLLPRPLDPAARDPRMSRSNLTPAIYPPNPGSSLSVNEFDFSEFSEFFNLDSLSFSTSPRLEPARLPTPPADLARDAAQRIANGLAPPQKSSAPESKQPERAPSSSLPAPPPVSWKSLETPQNWNEVGSGASTTEDLESQEYSTFDSEIDGLDANWTAPGYSFSPSLGTDDNLEAFAESYDEEEEDNEEEEEEEEENIDRDQQTIDSSSITIGQGFGTSDDDLDCYEVDEAQVNTQLRQFDAKRNSLFLANLSAKKSPQLAQDFNVAETTSLASSHHLLGLFIGRKLRKLPAAPRLPSTFMVLDGGTVRFSSRIILYDTYHEDEYDRHPDIATCNQLTPELAQQIKDELNEVKRHMLVHEDLHCYTHFF